MTLSDVAATIHTPKLPSLIPTRSVGSRSEFPMPYVCHFTGKKSSFGKQRTWRGQAVKRGGFGLKPTGITRRKFRPNLKRLTAMIDGVPTRIKVSTNAIKSGLVIKPLKRKYGYTRQQKLAALGTKR